MTGKVAADIVKPVPLSVAELIVTGAVPVEVNVTGSVDAVFTVTLPNARLAGLIVNCGLTTAACQLQLQRFWKHHRATRRQSHLGCQLARCRSPTTAGSNCKPGAGRIGLDTSRPWQ